MVPLLIFLFLTFGTLALIFIILNAGNNAPRSTLNHKLDNYIADQIARKFRTRRDYYRNVYLKSEAWKRKRYVVLKRDHWRCVYCGKQATEVHHKRYAKKNIGKEPIAWLVSVCKTCHDRKHFW